MFWDKEECEITDDLNAAQVLKNMRKGLLGGGHRGPVTFNAYGDITGRDFESTDIKLNHFPAGNYLTYLTPFLYIYLGSES